MPVTTIGYCFACDKSDLPVKSVGSVEPQLRACLKCRHRHGHRTLREAADRIVASRTSTAKVFNTCRHCGEPVLALPRGGTPLLCTKCVKEWGALAQ